MMIVHEKADGADMESLAEVAASVGCDVRALLEKAAAGEVMLHVALRPFTFTVATAHGERHPSFQGESAIVKRWQLLPQYAAALSNFREATVSHVPFPALENGPADTFYFVLSEPQTVTVEHLFVAHGHVVCDAPVSESPAAATTETAPARRARLLAWHVEEVEARSASGAVNRVTAREKLIRPTADRSNIGTDIRKAREEQANARRAGAWLGPLGK